MRWKTAHETKTLIMAGQKIQTLSKDCVSRSKVMFESTKWIKDIIIY